MRLSPNVVVSCWVSLDRRLIGRCSRCVSSFYQPAAPLHIHHTSDEVIHVCSGKFIVRLGEKTMQAGEGDWIFIPRGLLHGWRNIGGADGRAFFIFTPGGGGKTVEEMRFLGKFAIDIEPAERDEI